MLLCPHVVTGGPEAIHQLSDAIIGLGGEAIIAYYGNQVGLSIEDAAITCTFTGNPTPSAYRDYRAIVAARIPLTKDSLVLYPESIVSWLNTPRPFHCGVWWVSVDNAIVKPPSLLMIRIAMNFFRVLTLFIFSNRIMRMIFCGRGEPEGSIHWRIILINVF